MLMTMTRTSDMSDIFLSYERTTTGQAQIVAQALRVLGYRVWLDDERLACFSCRIYWAHTRVHRAPSARL